jgi:hypothetical protein
MRIEDKIMVNMLILNQLFKFRSILLLSTTIKVGF